MKFSDGCWHYRKNFNPLFPMEVYDHEKTKDKLVLYAPLKAVAQRGDVLNNGMLTLELTFPLENVICVKCIHHIGGKEKFPQTPLYTESLPLNFEEVPDFLALTNGNLSVKIQRKNGFSMEFFQDGKPLTGSSLKALSYIEDKDTNTFYMREQLSLDVGELIYGLGERFTPFVKNGQSVDIWNEDGGTGSEQAYKNIPFYLSSKGYGVFVNHTEKVSYEIASEKVVKAQFSVPGERLEYFIIGGPTPKEVLQRYTTLTGKPALPPAWTFGLWLSTSFTTDYSEETVMSFIDGMIERDIPFDTFHFDCFWMKGFEWCNFQWDKKMFPDPQGMLNRIKEKGLKICLWINPYIAQKSPLFKEGMENGYLLKRPDGSVWQWDRWQAGLGVVDFTNPEACKWYQSKLETLLDMGVDCFKTDFGERIPVDVNYHDGSDPYKMHNFYAYRFNEVVFELLERKFGKGKAVLFARSAAAGSQQFPVHWGGDPWSNYPSMAETLRGGLSFLLSGFGFWSHDISGFEKRATDDLFKRWSQFGLLSSHSRLHGSTEYKVPWFYGEESVDITRQFSKLKNRLMPYLYHNAVYTAQTGVPLMRPMILEFPDEENCYYLDRQYMLGDSLLVAPIFNDDGIAKYYLPDGKWTNFFTNEVKPGGKWHKESHDYSTLPLMVRENTILALGNKDNTAAYDYTAEPTFHAFELSNAITKIYDVNGKEVAGIKGIREDDTIIFSIFGKLPSGYHVLLRNMTKVSHIEGGTVLPHELGILITTKENTIKVKL